ncbi:MAG: MarR family winged helix-turn-helix transcriptional regulator [Acidiferrobacterales bacterium]
MPNPPNVTLTVDACREVLRECGSFNLRKASRVVTQLYDDILQPTGLRSTQVVVLVTLAVEQELSMVGLARQLVLSPSTLSRNIRPLERDGLIEIRDAGKRGKLIRLTARGRKALLKALPYWQKAQERFTGLVGVTAWAKLSKHLAATVTATRS